MKNPEQSKRKSSLFRRRSLLLAGVLALLAPPSANATDGEWTYTGNGNWFDAGNWAGGNIADGVGAVANLSGVTGRTISIAGSKNNVTLGEINFAKDVSPQWTLTGGTITLDSGTPGQKALITSANGGSTIRLDIASKLEGSSGLKIVGGRYTFSNTSNSFTGGVELSDNAIVVLYAGAFGSNQINIKASSVNLQLRNGTHSNSILLSANNAIIAAGVSGAVVAGTVSEATAGTNVKFLNNTANCLLEISGNNTYTGNTTIGATGATQNTTVRISSSTAFGSAAARANVAFNATSGSGSTLDLTNNINVTNRDLTLAGEGRDGKGSLTNSSGNNQWSGNIALGSASSATVSSAAGTTLILSGTISGSSTGGLTKLGEGTLALNGANEHTTGTFVAEGVLQAGNDLAVAGGDLFMSAATSLNIATGVHLKVKDLTLNTDTRLGFYLNGDSTDAAITVAGKQLGSGNYTVDIYNAGGLAVRSYTLLKSTQGDYAATGFVLGTIPGGFVGDLTWNAGVLTLNVIAVPETGSVVYLGTGIALTIFGALSRRVSSTR